MFGKFGSEGVHSPKVVGRRIHSPAFGKLFLFDYTKFQDVRTFAFYGEKKIPLNFRRNCTLGNMCDMI